MTFLFSILSAYASTGLVDEVQTEHGYICEYEQCSTVDEEGYEQAGGPNFTMYSTTPCPASVELRPITVDGTPGRLAISESTIALIPDPVGPGEPGEPVYNVQICFPLPMNTTFCYETTNYPSCRDWTLAQPGQQVPAGHSCDDLQ